MKHYKCENRVWLNHYKYTKYRKYLSSYHIKKMQRQLKNNRKNINKKICKLRKIRKIITVFLVCVILLSVGGGIVLSKTVVNYLSHQYKDISLEETMNKNPDNGLQTYALKFKNTYCQLFEELKLTDISTSELSYSSGTRITMRVSGKKDKFNYTVSGDFNKKNEESYTLLIQGNSEKSLVENFDGDKEVITTITKVMNIDNAFDKIEEGRTQIKPYSKNDNTLTFKQGSIYISEDLLNTWTKYTYNIEFVSKTSKLLDSAINETKTQQAAYQFVNRMDELYKNLGLENRYSMRSENRDIIYDNVFFSGTLEDVTYEVSADFYEDERIYYMLKISGTSSISILDRFPKDQEIIVKISEDLGIKDAYRKIDENRLLVKLEEKDGKRNWSYLKSNPMVQIFQSLEDEKLYYYSISLGIDWEWKL